MDSPWLKTLTSSPVAPYDPPLDNPGRFDGDRNGPFQGRYTRRTMDEVRFARIAKALADPQRLALMVRIAADVRGGMPDLVKDCTVSQATVSHHIRELAGGRVGDHPSRRQVRFFRSIPDAGRCLPQRTPPSTFAPTRPLTRSHRPMRRPRHFQRETKWPTCSIWTRAPGASVRILDDCRRPSWIRGSPPTWATLSLIATWVTIPCRWWMRR